MLIEEVSEVVLCLALKSCLGCLVSGLGSGEVFGRFFFFPLRGWRWGSGGAIWVPESGPRGGLPDASPSSISESEEWSVRGVGGDFGRVSLGLSIRDRGSSRSR